MCCLFLGGNNKELGITVASQTGNQINPFAWWRYKMLEMSPSETEENYQLPPTLNV